MKTSQANKMNGILTRLGVANLRPAQAELVDAAIQGADLFAVLPTGAGKSLCFQLPALAADGLTIVVSPLLSLMRDQVTKLKQAGFFAAMISSAQTENEEAEVIEAALSGRLKLLYLSPEQLAKSSVNFWLDKAKLERLVIDEAHCLSEWGHDFRPDYRALGAWIAKRTALRLSAFTATSTRAVQAEIEALIFSGRNPKTLIASPIRSNIEIGFVQKQQPRQQLLSALCHNEPTIIYAATRHKCEVLARALREAGYGRTRHYHAGLESDERADIEQAFLAGDLDMVVAIDGMGARRLANYGREILALFGNQVEDNHARRRARALSGQSERFERLQLRAQELRFGETGTERPLDLPEKLIERILRANPQTMDEFSRISGLSPAHIERFGTAFLLELRAREG